MTLLVEYWGHIRYDWISWVWLRLILS